MAYQGSTPSSATDNADAATADNATTADAILATDTVLAARRQAIASAPDPHGLATEAEIRAALIDRHGIDVQNRLDAARVTELLLLRGRGDSPCARSGAYGAPRGSRRLSRGQYDRPHHPGRKRGVGQ